VKSSSLGEVVLARARELQVLRARRARGEEVLTHVPTGLRAFDERFGGLELGVLTLVVGHTGDGKTALLGHLARAAAEAGHGFLLILLEDPAAKLAARFLAGALGESANALGRLQFDDDARLEAASAQVGGWASRVRLVSGQLSAAEALRLVDETEEVGGAKVRLVVVDYAQGFAEESNLEAVIAQLAWDLNARMEARQMAAVLGSQVVTELLSRGKNRWERTLAQGRPDAGGFRPGKGDVMWSRRAEQRCKAAWYIFREGRWRREMGDKTAKDDRMEIKVGKANFGPEGTEVFEWVGKSATIRDLPR
jgi:hypothetical protein